MTKTELLLTSATLPLNAHIICGLHTVTNKRTNAIAVYHNTAYKRDAHNWLVSEFMLNNTVRRLVQGQGYSNAYKLVQTCAAAHAAEQKERVQMFVDIAYRLSNEYCYENIIALAEDALSEFAERVDGVTLERVNVADYNSNPAMVVKGSIQEPSGQEVKL